MPLSLDPLKDSKHVLVCLLLGNFRYGFDYVLNIYLEIMYGMKNVFLKSVLSKQFVHLWVVN